MEAVSDLLGLGRALTNSLCVEPASIAADDLDLGMLREPFRCLLRRSDRQHVDDVATLQINDDRPIGETLAPAPVVNACDPNWQSAGARNDMTLEMPQNGIVACRDGQTRQQLLTGASARGMAKEPQELGDAAGSTRKRRGG